MAFLFGNDSSPPPAPDYSALAKEQGAANVEAARQTAYLSNPNIVNPYGKRTVTYNTTYATPEPVKPVYNPQATQPKTLEAAQKFAYDQGLTNPRDVRTKQVIENYMSGQYEDTSAKEAYDKAMEDYNKQLAEYKASAITTPTVTEELSPEQKAIFDRQMQVKQALADLGVTATANVLDIMKNPFKFQGPDIMTGLDLSNVAKMPVNAGTTGQQAIMSRLQPQLEARRESLRTSLINQGVPPGSEAYQRAMTDLSQQENDLVQQAALQGINLDMAANQAGFGQALQSANFGNTANEQAFQRQLGLYNLPLNQVAALMSGSQVNVPQFQGYQGAGVTAAPLFQAGQAKYQAGLDAYNADVAASNAQTQGIVGLASAAATAY